MNQSYYVLRDGEYIARDVVSYDVARLIAAEEGGSVVVMCTDEDGGACVCSGKDCLWE